MVQLHVIYTTSVEDQFNIDHQLHISPHPLHVTGITSLHSHSVLGRDSNKELSSIQAKDTSKGCEQSIVD